jgi:hypothetical protein
MLAVKVRNSVIHYINDKLINQGIHLVDVYSLNVLEKLTESLLDLDINGFHVLFLSSGMYFRRAE